MADLSSTTSKPKKTTKKTVQEEGTAQPQAQQNVRATFVANPNMGTVYANAFQTSFSKAEIFLTACISQAAQDKDGSLLSIEPQQRMIMTPESAKNLAAAMIQLVKQYESQNGPIEA